MEYLEKCMNLSLYYLGLRSRTEKEMADYLARKEMPKDAIQAVIERLIENGMINDEAYAERFAQLRIRKAGARKVAYELRAKGVCRETADRAIAAVDARDELGGAVRFARQSLRGSFDAKSRQRAYASLARRGYASSVIYKAMDIVREEEDNPQGDSDQEEEVIL